ncbi:type II toxin-antitoxin system ChpB family toxin [Candidatus Fukatsuia symbiotica]|uniref:type II toxin-antitoxin system ChpB family toxin n=1 Tax=Candidatus Fukatsuia TaxID=1927833 RepID=UPI0013C333CE|nr:type II toxin-antitoxin system ChpB family toxin [Candidatus Fukatsuia symbiotica]MEA9444456.1 type II toxin-antitoxin system ChpB family toxin [Candidatus Fukatsuia symbiotica]
MTRRKGFSRGDIVLLTLNPTRGKEQQGDRRPVLVLSPKNFNDLGMVLIAPITQGGAFSRYQGFTVTLSGSGAQTQGVVLLNQSRMVDITARDGEFIEKADHIVIEEALIKLHTLIE